MIQPDRILNTAQRVQCLHVVARPVRYPYRVHPAINEKHSDAELARMVEDLIDPRGLILAQGPVRRLGLTPPTDRAPVDYGATDWAERWLIALELEAFNSEPKATVKFLKDNWDRQPGGEEPHEPIGEIVRKAGRGKDLFVLVQINALDQENPIVQFGYTYKLADLHAYLSDYPARFGVFNLSARLRALWAELQ